MINLLDIEGSSHEDLLRYAMVQNVFRRDSSRYFQEKELRSKTLLGFANYNETKYCRHTLLQFVYADLHKVEILDRSGNFSCKIIRFEWDRNKNSLNRYLPHGWDSKKSCWISAWGFSTTRSDSQNLIGEINFITNYLIFGPRSAENFITQLNHT